MSTPATAGSCGEVISGWWHSPKAKKVLLIGGIAAGVLYALGDLISGLLYEGYSFRDQVISELTAFGSPVRPLMLTVMLVHSLLLAALIVGLWRSADRRSLRGVAAFFMAATVVGLPNHTVWAMSSRWMESGFNDTMHQIGSAAWVVLTFGAMVLSAVAYKGWFRGYSIATMLVFMGFGAASGFAFMGIQEGLPTPWAGGFERINAYAYFAWVAVLALTVMRRSLKRPDRTKSTELTSNPEEPAIPAGV